MATTANTEAARPTPFSAAVQDETSRAPRLNAGKIVLYAVLIAYSLFSLGPFLFAFLSSFKTESQVLQFPPALLPNPWTGNNYHAIFSGTDFPFPNYIFGSLLYAASTAALNVLFGAMAGYAFARMEFPGKSLLFGTTLAVLMIPGNLIMVPKFLVVDYLHLTNNYLGLIIPNAASAVSVFLMTQFLKTLPKELEESAFIDGCSRFGVFWRIILPLIRPAMITVAIIQFQGAWNDFIWPLLVMSSKYNYTLTVGLTFFKGVHYTEYGLLLAGAAINIAPLVVIFFFFQRYFMQGLSTSGLAGR
ncbi:MAG TPA: carbohydrate ABC transporter permease [Ktedonobacterales bacterium]|jgi:ABC-type glycerol-3-phosphate transport system permease component|nr:carbohydrate ABC transporter permease [Ktedonobacterales bacterium]